MIAFDVEAQKANLEPKKSAKTRYLLLGDFGGRVTEPVLVDRDNVDDVLSRLEVNLAGLRMRGRGKRNLETNRRGIDVPWAGGQLL